MPEPNGSEAVGTRRWEDRDGRSHTALRKKVGGRADAGPYPPCEAIWTEPGPTHEWTIVPVPGPERGIRQKWGRWAKRAFQGPTLLESSSFFARAGSDLTERAAWLLRFDRFLAGASISSSGARGHAMRARAASAV